MLHTILLYAFLLNIPLSLGTPGGIYKEELVPLTVNSLNQARFFHLRREHPRKAQGAKVARFKGKAEVQCGADTITFLMGESFTGRIFASRKETIKDCTTFVSQNSPAKFTISIRDTQCGLRQRTLPDTHPSSLIYSIRLIASHSFDHLTEDDQAFDLKCTYRPNNFTVETFYETNPFSPQVVSGAGVVPTCQYTLHKGSVNGPRVVTTKIGDTVFHRWSCSEGDYSFKVYNCMVHGGDKQSFLIVDEQGCSLDPAVLPHPVYDPVAHTVYASSRVFRFAKTKHVHFNCLLSVCMNDDVQCQSHIPPKCPRIPKKRQLSTKDISWFDSEESTNFTDFGEELQSKSTTDILQVDDLPRHPSDRNGKKSVSRKEQTLMVSSEAVILDGEVQDSGCLSLYWFVILAITNLCSIAVSLLACWRLAKNNYTLDLLKWKRNDLMASVPEKL